MAGRKREPAMEPAAFQPLLLSDRQCPAPALISLNQPGSGVQYLNHQKQKWCYFETTILSNVNEWQEWFTQQEITQGYGWKVEGGMRTREEELPCLWHWKGEVIDKVHRGWLWGCHHIGAFQVSGVTSSVLNQTARDSSCLLTDGKLVPAYQSALWQ